MDCHHKRIDEKVPFAKLNLAEGFFVKIDRNAQCWCRSGKKYKLCHLDVDEKIETYRKMGCLVPEHGIIKNEEQIKGIRESGKRNIEILNYIDENIKTGITTEEIDKLVYEKTIALGGIPAPLNYEGFPKSVCTSINEQVCHGIPSKDVILKEGDIINVDVSTIYNGYFSDSSRMYCIGNISDEKRKLVECTKRCVELGREQARPWGFMGDIGQAISDYASKCGLSVVRDVGGHGVGLEFHEEPWISYATKKGAEMLLVPGMVFTIEPMLNIGTYRVRQDRKNGWTIYTADGQPSAQWEIQIVITEKGNELLAY